MPSDQNRSDLADDSSVIILSSDEMDFQLVNLALVS